MPAKAQALALVVVIELSAAVMPCTAGWHYKPQLALAQLLDPSSAS